MADRELNRSTEFSADPLLPITSICIVTDPKKCPKGFSPITKAHDDGSDADLWKDSALSFFSRQVRYVAISRELPEMTMKASVSVVTDLTLVKDSDPIPHGYIAVDYTADSREKSLRKKFLCMKVEPRETLVDAIGEVVVLNKSKKTPKGYALAGEVDGAMICFKVVVIPQTFGLVHSNSEQGIPTSLAPPTGFYPNLNQSSSAPYQLNNSDKVNAFTIKTPTSLKSKGVDGVPFKLNPCFNTNNSQSSQLPDLTSFDIRRLDSDEFQYNFNLERATLSNFS